MEIYLVRHGQTDGNVAARHQHPSTPINEVGQAGAKALAEVLKAKYPTHIVSSNQRRALETARILATALDLIPIESDLFAELRRPGYLIGERRTGLVTLRYMVLWYCGYTPASYHDGETYAALRARIKEGKALLASLPPDARVVLVSHSAFITFFLAHLSSERPVGPVRAVWLLIKMLVMRNTSYIHIRFNAATESAVV